MIPLTKTDLALPDERYCLKKEPNIPQNSQILDFSSKKMRPLQSAKKPPSANTKNGSVHQTYMYSKLT